MKRHAPEIGKFMTRLPVEAERCETVTEAFELMRQHHIHHLPVMSGSQLKGVVSLTDILSARSMAADQTGVRLEEICQNDVLTASPVTPIDEVARQLLQRRQDSAVVIDGGFVVGIFTTTDVMRFVADSFGQAPGDA